MFIKIKETGKSYKVVLQLWRGGWNAGYEPDCFDDLEPNFPAENPRDDGGNVIASQADFNELVEFWSVETDAANAGKNGEVLIGLTPEEIANGDEWILTADQILGRKI